MRKLLLPALLACAGATCAAAPGVTAVTASAFNVSIIKSRVANGTTDVCVAPCAIMFDASKTTAPSLTSAPFAEILHSWSFGDSNGGAAWTTGTRQAAGSRNIAYGPVAVHVFEQPGTYTVTDTMQYSSTTQAFTVTVVVTDPDTYYSGTNTICVYNGGTPPVPGTTPGCPTGAATTNSASFKTVVESLTTGQRALFRGGDIFGAADTSAARLGVLGPITVGSYPTYGTKAIIKSNCSCANIINVGITTGDVADTYIKDWRFVDLEVDGQSGTKSMAWSAPTAGTADQMLFYRLDLHDITGTFNWDWSKATAANMHLFDQIYIVDVVETRNNSSNNHIPGKHVAYMGINSTAPTSVQTQTNRMQSADTFVISNNNYASSTNVSNEIIAPRSLASTLGPRPSLPNNIDPLVPTQYGVITENNIEVLSVGVQSGNCGPSCGGTWARYHHLNIEGNYFYAHASASNPACIWAWGSEILVANNICNLNVGTASTVFVQFAWDSVTLDYGPYYAYNNTYRTVTTNTPTSVEVNENKGTIPNPDKLVVQNNLMWAPSAPSGGSFEIHTYNGTPPTTFTHSNNTRGGRLFDNSGGTGNSQSATDPLFTNGSTLFNAATDFALQAGSYGYTGGTTVPVWQDFFRLPNGATRSIGAVSH